jgi:FMN phosphatase YigB (HAD superfamily)
MILDLARPYGIQLARSWVVGDILDDIEAGRRAGCRTILIDNGHETEWVLTPLRRPHYRAADLAEAVQFIGKFGEPGAADSLPNLAHPISTPITGRPRS